MKKHPTILLSRITRALALLSLVLPGAKTLGQLTISRLFTEGVNIPDNGELALEQNLAVGGGSIAHVEASLQISGFGAGGWNGDLYVALGHSTGYAVLVNRPGRRPGASFGYGDSGMNVTFADTAANGDIHRYRQTLQGSEATPLGGALTGTWAPDGRQVNPAQVGPSDTRSALLSTFQGLNPDGAWRLFVADVSGGGSQRLDSWGLKIQTTEAPSGALTFSGDTVEASAGAQSLNNQVLLQGDVTFGGSYAMQFNGGTALQGQRTVEVNVTTTLGGGVSESQTGSGLLKTGMGSLVLTGAGTYSGSTLVNGGSLVVNNLEGSATGTGPVVVNPGGRLTGGGAVAGSLTVASGGTIAPGNSPGTLTVGDTTMQPGGSYLWEINDATGTVGADPGWDLLSVNGTLTIQATSVNPFNVQITSLTLANTIGSAQHFNSGQAYTWKILGASTDIVGFDPSKFNLDRSGFANTGLGLFSLARVGNDLVLNYNPVPEPAAAAVLFGLGLVGFAVWRRPGKK